MALIDPMLDPEVKFSVNRFPGNGSTVSWDLNFSGGFIRREHVKAYTESLDGSIVERTIIWDSDTSVRVEPAVPAGQTLVIYRDTPKGDPLVDFSDGSIINEANLDLLAKQSVFVAAEMVDRFSDVASQSGVASAQAVEALAIATEALTASSAALTASGAASEIASDVAAQFEALLATVQDLSGADLSLLARLNLPQTYTAPQTFPSVFISSPSIESELVPGGYRVRVSGGVWSTAVFNSWDDITGKPAGFPPLEHSHAWSSIFGKPTAFPPEAHTHPWTSITGKPDTFPPSSHNHAWSEITGRPEVAVNGQPANFSLLTVNNVRVPTITVSASQPSGGANGDIWYVV